MVELNRKDNESVEAFLRRFKKKLQRSGKLIQARGKRFYTKQKSKNLRRVDAIKRDEIRDEKEYLKKIGKFKPEKKSYQR